MAVGERLKLTNLTARVQRAFDRLSFCRAGNPTSRSREVDDLGCQQKGKGIVNLADYVWGWEMREQSGSGSGWMTTGNPTTSLLS